MLNRTAAEHVDSIWRNLHAEHVDSIWRNLHKLVCCITDRLLSRILKADKDQDTSSPQNKTCFQRVPFENYKTLYICLKNLESIAFL